MTDELMRAFDDSLAALAAGESVSAIVARYPRLGEELRPMLEAAVAARQLGSGAPVPPAAENRSRAQLLTRAAALRGQGRAAPRLWARLLAPANRAVAITLAFVLGFVLGSYGVLTASAESLPGEPLYRVKRTVEQTQLLLSLDPRARERLETDFSERRVEEVERLLAAARRAEVAFGGVLEARDGERWSVAGIQVIVPGSAELIGTPFTGLYVSIEGLSQADGTVVANRAEVTGLAFMGTLRVMGGETWQVGDTVLVVNADTAISGTPQPGDRVAVNARRLPEGTWLALSIVMQPDGPEGGSAGTPAPSATATPGATPSASRPAPSATPAATQAPVEVRFTGIVEAIGAQSWQIAGQTVQITPGTEVRDNPQVGQLVEMRALRAANGALTALRIEAEGSGGGADDTPEPGEDHSGSSGGPGPSPSNTPAPNDDNGGGGGQEQRWEGTLDAINGGTWVIAGQAVSVNGDTEIRDNPQVGDVVEVRAVVQADGTLLAVRIERRD